MDGWRPIGFFGGRMIYIKYLIMAIASTPLTLLSLVFAPALPLFAELRVGWCDNHSYEDVEPRLYKWLSWFQTPDNSLYGDSTFIKNNGYGYWAQVKWLWRNPCYSFGLKYLTPPYSATFLGDKTIRDNDNAKAGWCFVRAGGLFQFVAIKQIGKTQRCARLALGWNIMALVDDNVNPKPNPYQATFVFSPRLSGFR